MAKLLKLVREVMTEDILKLTADISVKDAAAMMSERKVSGAPVVDDEGNLIGIVTDSDLIMREVRIHFPTFIQLLDGYIYLPGSLDRFNEEFKKAVGMTVGDVLSKDVITIDAQATVEDAATLMVEEDVDRMPVIADGKLVGIITKGDLVRAISKE